MSGPVFVVDAGDTPLMPMSPAYARKLVSQGKARRLSHSVFTVIQLSQRTEQPHLRPIVAALRLHFRTAELVLVSEGKQAPQLLLHLIIDLRTDLPRQLRRRAGHRRRRRGRQRYHALLRHGRPFKLRRPSFARSAWGSVLLRARSQCQRQTNRGMAGTPVFRWRAQAISRTINALRQLVPISHIILLDSSGGAHHESLSLTSSERRQRLIEAYGCRDAQGKLLPSCAYCRTTEGIIEVEHLDPVSRGGTDAWENLALACQSCNRRKGDQTLEEAGMSLLLQHKLHSQRVDRLQPYVKGTLRALRSELSHSGLKILSPASLEQSSLHQAVVDAVCLVGTRSSAAPKLIVAYPVPRPRKQHFSSRNYPMDTPERADLMPVGKSLKRRVRVNQGLRLCLSANQVSSYVIPVGKVLRSELVARGLLIRPGMLCSATRAGRTITGIVSAIHTSGRLTLRILVSAQPHIIVWQSVVVSPSRNLRLLSSDRVLMMPV